MLSPVAFETLKNQILYTDLLTLCGVLPSQSVDMILCDLPYGTTACSWDSIIPLEPMWVQFKRVIKPRGAIVLTASQPFTSRLVMSAIDWFKYQWVWIKSIAGDIFNAKNKPLKQHEDVLIFSSGMTANGSGNKMPYFPQGITKIPNGKVQKNHETVRAFFAPRPSHEASYIQEFENYPTSILSFDNDRGLHPTQKPVALFEYLIRTYTQPGELVLDPCIGSGTTGIAARQTGRNFIGGDITWEYVQVARDRLAKPYTPPLFLEEAS